jgi:vacuole morphology and inheritance protein 14
MSVKNGAELLDRLMKDIVAEAAPNYISIYPGNINLNLPQPTHDPIPARQLASMHLNDGLDASGPGKHSPSTSMDFRKYTPNGAAYTRSSAAAGEGEKTPEFAEDKRAFNLARFIPLLSERVYVISPYTRMHLVSWLMILDSVPDLELVAWLPDFLDGLL